ncbi:MAG: galactose oxidase, partial [Pseudomonadota bacterium]
VKVLPPANDEERRSFVPSPECYRGDIDSLDPSRISWRQISNHPGPALYRSAAEGSGGQVVFFGGTDNPYNYNGVGYNGIPSEPRNGAFAYVVAEDRWEALAVQARPTMDHRALLTLAPGRWLVIGGMDESRELLSTTAPITAEVDL